MKPKHNGIGCPLLFHEEGYAYCFQSGKPCQFRDIQGCEDFRTYELKQLHRNYNRLVIPPLEEQRR